MRPCGVGGCAPGSGGATLAPLRPAPALRCLSRTCGGPKTGGAAWRHPHRSSAHSRPHYSPHRCARPRLAPAQAGGAVGGGAAWLPYGRSHCPARALRAPSQRLGPAPAAARATRGAAAAAAARRFAAIVRRSTASDMSTVAETRHGVATAHGCCERTGWRRARTPLWPVAGDWVAALAAGVTTVTAQVRGVQNAAVAQARSGTLRHATQGEAPARCSAPTSSATCWPERRESRPQLVLAAAPPLATSLRVRSLQTGSMGDSC